MKVVFKTFITSILVSIAIIAFMLVRTLNYGDSSQQDIEAVKLPDPPEIDANMAAANLSDIIRIETVTYIAGDPPPERDQPWWDLHAFIEDKYETALSQMEKQTFLDYSLLYTWKGKNPDLQPIVMMAHQDVVPINPATAEDWTRPPFSGEITNGYIYGRGSMDDKGSLIAHLEAANALVKAGWQPTRDIILMFGHDEEVAGAGAQAMFDHLKEKGIRPIMVLDEGFGVMDPFPLTGKPAGLIAIAEKGYMTVKITIRDAGGHSSTPERESGAVRLARAIIALEENQRPSHINKNPVDGMLKTMAADMPFMTRFLLANQWAFKSLIEGEFSKSGPANAMIRTTTAPTMLNGSIKENVLPQAATAIVNFRIHPNDSSQAILQHIRDVIGDIPGASVELNDTSGIVSPPSPVSSMESDAYRTLKSIAHSLHDDVPVGPGLMLGATDSRFAFEVAENVYRFTPAIYQAEDLKGFHGTNERLSIENIERMSKSYAQIMMVMASE